MPRASLARTVFFVAGLLILSVWVDNLTSARFANLRKRSKPSRALAFEANRGQVTGKYRFLARDPFGVFLLASNEFVYGRGRAAVHFTFGAANQQAQITGLDLQKGQVNYLLGKDASKWIRNVPSYARVQVSQLYPGIDAVYYGSEGTLETDFVVQPHADPGAVRLRVEDGASASVTSAGDLQVETPGGAFHFHRPVVYQQMGEARRQIAGRYVLRGGHEVGFAISRYDPSRPLVIDPVLSYSSYIGGSNSIAVRVAVDSQGNAYLAGATTSASYPVTAGAIPAPGPGTADDVLVTKFNAQGAIIYSTHVGGSHDDIGFGIAVDTKGQAYVTGSTTSQDFPTAAAVQAKNRGSGDAFVFALNAAGTGFVYSTYLGGSALDAGTAIAVDTQGNAYVAGATDSATFPTVNALQVSLKGGKGGTSQPFFLLGDAFVTKLSPSGTIVYSTFYGGSDDDAALAIAVDSSGSPYVAGFTTSTDFPLKNPLQPKYGGLGSNNQIVTGDAFVFKLTPDGSQAVYSTYLGGSADDVACGIAVDASGNAYLAGSTFSANFPTVNAAQASNAGPLQDNSGYFSISSGDAFVAKINPSGSALVFSTYLGGAADDRAYAIAVDAAGSVHVAGNTASGNFPVTSDAAQPRLAGVGMSSLTNLLPGGYVKAPFGFGDAFYARYTSSGALAYNTYLGGADDDIASGLAVDLAGDAYLSGNTASVNFPLAGSSYQTQLGPIVAVNAAGNQVTSLLFGDAFFAIFRAPPSTPAISPVNGVIGAGQFGAFSSVAPGSWIEIYGSNLAVDARQWATSDFQGSQAPISLDQTSVTIGGQSAFVAYISPGQVNAQVPSTVGTGPQKVIVTTAAGSSAPYTVTVNQVQPGLLAPSSFVVGGTQFVVALFSDNTYVLPAGAISGIPSRPAMPGETIVLYGVGFGPVAPAIPAGQIVQESNMLTSTFQVFAGGVPAKIAYAGLAPNYVGLYQFDIVVPNVASGALPLTFTLAGTNSSQTLYLAVQ